MKYRYQASETFWRRFHGLPDAKKAVVREKWRLFRVDPFDPRLGTHRINSLSVRARQTVYAVVVEGDLRVVFLIEGDTPSLQTSPPTVISA